MALPDDDLGWFDDPQLLFERVAEMAARPLWHKYAACRGKGPADWFPERGQTLAPALAVCAGCPVADRCRDTALAGGEKGVWGGLSEVQRRRLRRAQRAA